MTERSVRRKGVENVSETAASAPDVDQWYKLLHWNDLPDWQQDNHYILGGYRQASYSYKRSFASIFYFHNETVNIWTHLIPGALAIPTGIWLYQILKPRYDRANAADVFAMSCFFLGAALCLGMSATYHTLGDHSPIVAKFWNQLDYAGIACLIAGSFVPTVYYGFWCDPNKQLTYWIMIISLGIACTIASVVSRFRTPAWRPYRAAMFVGMGVSAVFPILDGLNTYGFDQMRKQVGLSWVLLQGGLYIFGAGLYAARIPERWYPGKFDIFGSSHQIFHILVVLAAVSHLNGLIKAFDYRHGIPGALCL